MVRLDVDMDAGVCRTDDTQFVEVSFARNLTDAERLRRYLETRSIPAQTERNLDLPVQCGVAILVPAERLVDASEMLTKMAHDDEDDDFVIDDDDDDDSDDDFEDDDDVDLDDDSDFEDDDDDSDEDEEEI